MPAERPARPLPPRTVAEQALPARPLPPRPVISPVSDQPIGGLGPARRPSARPDPRPMRTLLGLTGVAALAAFATAMTAPSAGASSTAVAQAQEIPAPSVIHVKKFVQLKPGETAPPAALVQAAPAATPRVVVVTTTRQSGKP